MKINCLLIRHGKTQGNIEKRYIGCRTDEPLLSDYEEIMGLIREKLEEGDYRPLKVFVSPMLRCRQTADSLFPGVEQFVIEDLRETDFGDFENKNYSELCNDPEYQRWIDSNGTRPFPNGEDREACIDRTVKAFQKTLFLCNESVWLYEKKEKSGEGTVDSCEVAGGYSNEADFTVAFVIHGGSIMAIMSSLTGKDYYDFQVGCCDGFVVECLVENDKIYNISYDSLFGGNHT